MQFSPPFVCLSSPGVPSVTGVLSALRSLAFIPVSFSLAYVARGEEKTLCDSRVLWKLYHSTNSTYILFTSINNTCSIVLLIVPTHGVRFLVHVGVGRFKNKSYTDFLKAWNTARGLKTKIGPLEVCTGLASYQCLPKRLGTRLAHLQLNHCSVVVQS